MKRTLLLPFLSLFPACTVGHMVGENQQNHDAITCATTQCNGTTVCVDSQCVEPTGTCGGFAGLQCPAGERCVDNPRDTCDPNNGGADCGGVCVAAPPSACGGFAGLQCPAGERCVDDPTDSCDPNNGGADCGGVCVAAPPTTQDAGTQTDGGTKPMSCGGEHPSPQMCPSGYKCVDDPNGCSMAVDCPGICVVDTPVVEVIAQCGGLTPFPTDCGAGKICIDHPTNCCMANDAPGICINKVSCGGFAGLPCPGNLSCVDDPTDSCNPSTGADCPGICVVPRGAQFCGGLPGFTCPTGLRCVDDPADSCDMNGQGGADCTGICVP